MRSSKLSERGISPSHIIQANGEAQTSLQAKCRAWSQATRKTGLPINDGVQNQLSQSQQRNARDQGNGQAMGSGMSNQPPAPIEGDIVPGHFLERHPIRLKREIANEVRQHQRDQ